MIDKENEVFTRVFNAIEETFGVGVVDMTTVYINEPNDFPHVYMELFNSLPAYEDGSLTEKYTKISIEFNIYSNKTDGRKEECKRIASVIDTAMRRMNFRRTAMSPVRNSTQTTVYGTDVHDETVYRLVSRYEGVASGSYFYRR